MGWIMSLIMSLLGSGGGGKSGGGGGGGMGSFINIANKDTYTDKKYGIAQNIFDPGGQTGFWDSKKKKAPNPFDIIRQLMQERFNDPYFKGPQEKLYKFGTDVVEGDLPDYYKQLGEYGSEQFEDVLGLAKRDVREEATRAGLESAAKLGLRGGRGAATISSNIARSLGDLETNMRFSDYQRALGARERILPLGLTALSGVRAASLGETDAAMNFLQLGLQSDQMQYQRAAQEGQAQGQAMGSGLSSIGGLLGSFGGGQGGAASAPRGSAGGTTGTQGLSSTQYNNWYRG